MAGVSGGRIERDRNILTNKTMKQRGADFFKSNIIYSTSILDENPLYPWMPEFHKPFLPFFSSKRRRLSGSRFERIR
jgi:hypothetical protein